MFTLILPGRSHIIDDASAARLTAAIENGKRLEYIQIELNGEGSGDWDVAINVAQVIAIVRHNLPEPAESGSRPDLQLVNSREN